MATARSCALMAIGGVLFCLVSSAHAELYRVTCEMIFTASDFPSYPQTVFGVEVGPGCDPVTAHASFLVDADVPLLHFYPTGTVLTWDAGGGTIYNRTTVNDLYGHSLSTMSDLTASFGTKTWDTADIEQPYFGAMGSAGVWFDMELADGIFPNIVLSLRDGDGTLAFGSMYASGDSIGMFSDSRGRLYNHALGAEYDSSGGTTITVTKVVPAPVAVVLGILGLGTAGVRLRRRN